MANIDVSNLEPNSYKYKAEKARNEVAQNKERTKPIINHDQIVSTKKPLGKKIAETFMTEDTKDVKTWLIMDVLIPGLKNTILESISPKNIIEITSRMVFLRPGISTSMIKLFLQRSRLVKK